jgi:hypothetical protein
MSPDSFSVYFMRPDGTTGGWKLNHEVGFSCLEHAKQSADACSRMGFDAIVNDPKGRQVYFCEAARRS